MVVRGMLLGGDKVRVVRKRDGGAGGERPVGVVIKMKIKLCKVGYDKRDP